MRKKKKNRPKTNKSFSEISINDSTEDEAVSSTQNGKDDEDDLPLAVRIRPIENQLKPENQPTLVGSMTPLVQVATEKVATKLLRSNVASTSTPIELQEHSYTKKFTISHKRRSNHVELTPSKRSKNCSVESKHNQSNPITNYFNQKKNELFCVPCNRSLKISAECVFHSVYHRNRKCCECKKSINRSTMARHIELCLLKRKDVTTNDMLKFMQPIQVILKKHIQIEESVAPKTKPKETTKSISESNEVSGKFSIQIAKLLDSFHSLNSIVFVLVAVDSSVTRETESNGHPILSTTNFISSNGTATTNDSAVTAICNGVDTNEQTLQVQNSIENNNNLMPTSKRKSHSSKPDELFVLPTFKSRVIPIQWQCKSKEKIFSLQKTSDGTSMATVYKTIRNMTIDPETTKKVATICLNIRKSSENLPQIPVSIPSSRITVRRETIEQQPPEINQFKKIANRRKSIHVVSIPHSIGQQLIQQTPNQINKIGRLVPIDMETARNLQLHATNKPTSTAPVEQCNTIDSNSSPISDSSSTQVNESDAAATTSTAPKTFKVLSVNELNQRADLLKNTNNDEPITPTTPTTPTLAPMVNQSPQISSPISQQSEPPSPQQVQPVGDSALDAPIHVALIKRTTGELDLTLQINRKKVLYDNLNTLQRIEVQRSLLADDVWLRMMSHIKTSQTCQRALDLFRRILPPKQALYFFAEIERARESITI